MVNIGVKKYVSSLKVFVVTSLNFLDYLDFLDSFTSFNFQHAFFKVVVKQAFSKHARSKAFFKQG